MSTMVGEGRFSEMLRAARLAAGMTQEDLAARSGLSVRAISDLERDRTRRPYFRSVRLLVEALGVPDSVQAELLDAAHRARQRADRPPGGTSPDSAAAAVPVIPRQLPPPMGGFIGRRSELQVLTDLAQQASAGGTAVVISAIDGTAGVGKTALALHWAHQVAAWFPDGHLYVNLRGFSPTGPPMTPDEAVRGFLDAFALPPSQVPAGPDAQIGLYRSLLANRRVLVVLDNAHDETQVRPLLPAGPACVVIVTSRNRLTGLAVTEGAHLVGLDVLTESEARELLTRRLGSDRTSADPGAVTALIRACARLPLALSVAAARAAAHPQLPLATVTAQVTQARSRLDAFDTGDAVSSVRSVLSWSYQDLDASAARMFRLLATHSGPDISAPAAASIAACSLGQARQDLDRLTRAHLTAEHTLGRFAFHDLMRAYAAEQAHATDDDHTRRVGTHRMLDHYLHTAHAAALLLHPGRDPLPLAPPQTGVAAEHLTDDKQALAWFTAEYPVLLGAIAAATQGGFDSHAWQLPWTLVTFLFRRGHWHQWVALERTALAAAQRCGDQAAQARVLLDLGYADTVLGRHDDADADLRRALELFQQTGNLPGLARVHNALAYTLEFQGRYHEGLHHAQRSLELFQAAGNRASHANAVSAVGWFHALLGDYKQALSFCQRAMALNREISNRHGEADIWHSLGYVHHHLGRHALAISCYQHALALFRDIGDRYRQTTALSGLGDAHCAAGHPRAARRAWREAATILDDLRHPDASNLKARLSRLTATQSPLRESGHVPRTAH